MTEAEFAPFANFKTRWHNRGRSFVYEVTDYLSGAPDSVLFAYTDAVVAKSAGYRKEYGYEYHRWISSPEFIEENRPSYIARSRNITRSPEGTHRSLYDSLDRLISSGFLDGSVLRDSYFTWTKRPGYTKVGSCNTVFRVVSVSSSLDSEDVPEEVLDYVVYHECLHLSGGYRPGKRPHDREFRMAEREFPYWKKAEKFLCDMKK
ncbi:MAG: hypothetical protein ACOX8L_03535 [Candidatus Methanomethylophilaceae archaeon]